MYTERKRQVVQVTQVYWGAASNSKVSHTATSDRPAPAQLHVGAAGAAARPRAGRAARGAGGVQFRRTQQAVPHPRPAASSTTHYLR